MPSTAAVRTLARPAAEQHYGRMGRVVAPPARDEVLPDVPARVVSFTAGLAESYPQDGPLRTQGQCSTP